MCIACSSGARACGCSARAWLRPGKACSRLSPSLSYAAACLLYHAACLQLPPRVVQLLMQFYSCPFGALFRNGTPDVCGLLLLCLCIFLCLQDFMIVMAGLLGHKVKLLRSGQAARAVNGSGAFCPAVRSCGPHLGRTGMRQAQRSALQVVCAARSSVHDCPLLVRCLVGQVQRSGRWAWRGNGGRVVA